MRCRKLLRRHYWSPIRRCASYPSLACPNPRVSRKLSFVPRVVVSDDHRCQMTDHWPDRCSALRPPMLRERVPRAHTDFPCGDRVTLVPYRDRPPGLPIACFRRSERRPTALSPGPLGWRRVQSRSTLRIYTNYVFTPLGRHPSGHISGRAVQPSKLRRWSCCLTTREDRTEGEVGEVPR